MESQTTQRSQLGTRTVLGLLVVGLALALSLASPGRAGLPDLSLSPITVGPVTVANGLVTVNGSVGGASLATANLTVNGQPVGLDLEGRFGAVVNLGGRSEIELVLDALDGQQHVLRIPLSLLGPGGVIPQDALQPLLDAGIELTLPPGGLVTTDGGGLTIDGRVLAPDALLSLTVNGRQVTPGANGGFTAPVPPGTNRVVVVATGTNGVSQTSSFPIAQLTSTISTAQGTSVAAAGADGIVIARVTYRPNAKTKRVRMVVTVKDRRGYLVRDAIIQVNALPGRAILGGAAAATTNRVGRATLVVRPRAATFGARLTTRTTAKTPTATASAITGVKLPRLAR